MAAIQPSSTVLDLQPGNLDSRCSDGPEALDIPCEGMIDEAYEVAASGLEVDDLRPVVRRAASDTSVDVESMSHKCGESSQVDVIPVGS